MGIQEQTNDRLLEDMVYWTRVYRTEGSLQGTERDNFQAICKEIYRRRLLSPLLYRDRSLEG
jgi:hypothetical protein